MKPFQNEANNSKMKKLSSILQTFIIFSAHIGPEYREANMMFWPTERLCTEFNLLTSL